MRTSFRLPFARVLALCVFASPVIGQVTTYWVDDDGSDSTGFGTSAAPWATINHAVSAAGSVQGPVLIKIKDGTYDWDHENTYTSPADPFPISLPAYVDIIAADTGSQSTWPRIGGGVPDSDVGALLSLVATTGNRPGIDIKNLYFVGELVADQDGPAPLLVQVSGGYSGAIAVDTCYFERPVMDDDTHQNRRTIQLEVGWGSATVTVGRCTIEAAEAGGVVMLVGQDTTSTHKSEPVLNFLDNTIKVGTGESSDVGILIKGSDDQFMITEDVQIIDNVIDSSLAGENAGIETGIKLDLEQGESGDLQINHGHAAITGNTIKSGTGDGIWLRSADGAHIAIFTFDRNEVRDCAGAAIRLDHGLYPAEGGYLNSSPKSNMLVRNGYGFYLEGLGSGPCNMTNNTVVDNENEGIYLASTTFFISSITNCIVYHNNSDGPQHGGISWDPFGTDVSYFEYNNWLGYFQSSSCDPNDDTTGRHNVDSDPGFVNRTNGDYHLTSSACSRNKGDNFPESSELLNYLDIDGQRRIADDSADTVDQGADEYTP